MTLTCRFTMHKDQVKAICILHVYHSSKNESYHPQILPILCRGISFWLWCSTNLRSVYEPWEWSLDDDGIHLRRKPRMTNFQTSINLFKKQCAVIAKVGRYFFWSVSTFNLVGLAYSL